VKAYRFIQGLLSWIGDELYMLYITFIPQGSKNIGDDGDKDAEHADNQSK
jgi:hypothetical protein